VNNRAAWTIEAFGERRQASLLAQAAHNLTVSAREAYETSPDGPEYLRRYNEIQHLLTAHVSSLLKQSGRRSSETLLGAIDEIAGRDAMGQRIRERVEWALSLALENAGHS
jgi:hypothetical protein